MSHVFTAANHDLQSWARSIWQRARCAGDVVAEPCVVCGAEKTQGHHEDYARPLDVVWLCAKHHYWRHRSGYTVDEMRATQARVAA